MNYRTAIHFSSMLCLIKALGLAQAKEIAPTILGGDIQQSTLADTNQRTAEISTAELRQLLASPKAVVFDARPHLEYAISHIPGAVNVSAKPGVSKALYISDVAEIGRILQGDKTRPVIVYCNGPHCGKAKRLADELVSDGYASVKRYQLGVPVWRALGYPTQIEADGIAHIYRQDKTAVWIDARNARDFTSGTLPGARSLPASTLDTQSGQYQKDNEIIKQAKEDGRLPMNDHNTRIIVFGQDGRQAQQVAEMIAKEAFHNVSFFDGRYQQLHSIIK